MSARTKCQALSSGHAHQSGGPQHLGACQRHSRLAYLCRVRSAFNHHRAQALCWRCSCSTAQGDGLRAGLYPHRSVPWYVQVDALTTKQGWGEVAYVARSARRHSCVHVRKPGTLRRNQDPRSASARTGRFLTAGSPLRGLCTFVSFPPSRQLLCDSSQVQSESAATFLAASRSQHGIDLRSDGCAQLSAIAVQLSAPVAPNSHARFIFGKHSGASDQPFRFACPDHLRAVPLSLADRAVLQVDKAAPSDQSILRYFRECSQNSDLDRSISVRAHRHRKEASQSASFTIRAPTTLEPDYVRANAATRPVNCISAPKPFVFNHAPRFIRLNVGTLLPSRGGNYFWVPNQLPTLRFTSHTDFTP